ncbi:MAG: hypothetical protein ACFFAS_00510 [Promethearchaeota archaeon]
MGFCLAFTILGSEVQATPTYKKHYYDDYVVEYQRPVYNNSATDYQSLAVVFDDLGGDFVNVIRVNSL